MVRRCAPGPEIERGVFAESQLGMSVRVYAYSGCDTCRRALKFLHAIGVDPEVIPIRERPPSLVELRLALKSVGEDPRRLFNISGRDYRELNLASRLPGMPLVDVLRLLRENGNLVKRPFVVAGDRAWVGFDELSWKGRFRAACP